MGYLEGLLGGFVGRKYDVEAQNLKAAQDASAREGKVYEALLASPDPEIQAHALTGLLTSAQAPKRAGGIRGWLGEMQSNPAYEQIKNLIGTPVTAMEPVPGAPQPAAGVIAHPPGATLAQSPTAATTPGAPPLTAPEPAPAAAAEPTGAAVGAPAIAPRVGAAGAPALPSAAAPATEPAATPGGFAGGQRTVLRPRHILMSPEEAMLAQRRGAAQGDVEGEVAGLVAAGATPEEARAAVLRRMQRTSVSSLQSVAGEMPDGTAAFGVFDRTPGSPTYGKYIDPDTGRPLEGFRPRTTTGSTTLGADREAAARRLYGKRASQLVGAEMAHVEAEVLREKGQLTPNQALSAASRMLPNATVEQQTQLADELLAGTAAPVMGGAPVVAPSVGAPPPAGSAAPAAAPAAPGTPTPAPTVGAPPPAATPGRPSIRASVSPELSGATRETGKPLPASVSAALAKARSTNDLIDQALKALAPFKDDNTLEGSIKLAHDYRMGIFDPVATTAAQLSDLAGLQSSAQAQLTGGSSRALRYYVDRRQHVPRLPSGRQIDAASAIGPTATSHVSQWMKGEEGGFDSPKLMYEKLVGARKNNQSFIDELEKATAETKAGGAIYPVSSHGPGAAPTTTPTAHKDASGNWVISIP